MKGSADPKQVMVGLILTILGVLLFLGIFTEFVDAATLFFDGCNSFLTTIANSLGVATC